MLVLEPSHCIQFPLINKSVVFLYDLICRSSGEAGWSDRSNRSGSPVSSSLPTRRRFVCLPFPGAWFHTDPGPSQPPSPPGGDSGRPPGPWQRWPLWSIQGPVHRRLQGLDALRRLQPGGLVRHHRPVTHVVQGHHAADRAVQPAACGGVLREDVVQWQAEEEAQEHDGEVPAGAGQRQESPQQEPRWAEPDAEGREHVGGVAQRRRGRRTKRTVDTAQAHPTKS